MCGIAGIFAYGGNAPPVNREELLRIREAMARRGPDGEGLWVADDGRIGFAHRRLTIIDLSDAGAQPMWNGERTLCVTFNGEIYNYRELRRQLEGKGYRFHSTSDTEVLLHLYADRRQDMVHALRGMYAFAIWDERGKNLFLARDPFGIKPLYYADDGTTFRFASQVKALLRSGAIGEEPDPAGRVGFFLLGSVPEPFTIYRNIHILPAGATLHLARGPRAEPARFFNIAQELAQAEAAAAPRTEEEMQERVADALRDTVRAHLVADVPVGIFLSSGIDSTVMTSIATEVASTQLRTITLGFSEYQGTANDEAPLAERFSRLCGTRHESRFVDYDAFTAELDVLIGAMDQPSIDGVNTYFVSKIASECGTKVAFSGVGGDELFAGYPSYREIPALVRTVAPLRCASAVGRLLRRAAVPFIRRISSPKYASIVEYGGTWAGAYLLRRGLFMPWELGNILGEETARAGLQALDIFGRLSASIEGLNGARAIVTALELQWYLCNQLLRDSDWAGMAHSLEIRVPYVDVELFRALAPLIVSPKSPTKYHVARVPHHSVPDEILHRPKTGFVIPVRDWLGRYIPRYVRDRGVRGWAHYVYPIPVRRRFLSLATDAFGGYGGIAQYNRDFLTALCKVNTCEHIVTLPRLVGGALEPIPAKLEFRTAAAGGKLVYLAACIRLLFESHRYDLVICSHINLLPLGYFLARWFDCPIFVVIYGIDAWQPTRGAMANWLSRKVDRVVSISEITAQRFRVWSGIDESKIRILPNAVELSRFGLGSKPIDLNRDLALAGKTVIMTIGRLAEQERCKGFDEIIEALPALRAEHPNLVYLICGDGPDRERLERKAKAAGLDGAVVFTGFVPEERKADYYRLADAYVMPSHGEGFGFVILEALACGIPVVGSKLDGTREALRGGELGMLVDPARQDEILVAVGRALSRPRHVLPGLEYFSRERFDERLAQIVREFFNDECVDESGVSNLVTVNGIATRPSE